MLAGRQGATLAGRLEAHGTMLISRRAGTSARIFNERRGSERLRAFKGGLIRFNDGYGTMNCLVRNLSARGARLSFGDAVGVPRKFQLKLGASGGWRGVTVRWRRGSDVGISFD